MDYKVIGINGDGTMTVRMVVGKQVIDEVLPLPVVATLDTLIDTAVKTRLKQLADPKVLTDAAVSVVESDLPAEELIATVVGAQPLLDNPVPVEFAQAQGVEL